MQLGRNAVSIYQDLVEQHGFAHRYNTVKRFVARLRARVPERFDVLEFLPGEESQVDYGQGAMTLHKPGKYKRPYLFVMTLKYSGKSFRKTVWRTNQQIWAQLHEEAFRALGGCPQYVVLDNLKEGVIRPDIYAPELNPVYGAMLAHYGVVADPQDRFRVCLKQVVSPHSHEESVLFRFAQGPATLEVQGLCRTLRELFVWPVPRRPVEQRN